MAKRIFAKIHTTQNINIYSKVIDCNGNNTNAPQYKLLHRFYPTITPTKMYISLPKHLSNWILDPTNIPIKTHVLVRKSIHLEDDFSKGKNWVIGNLKVYFGLILNFKNEVIHVT